MSPRRVPGTPPEQPKRRQERQERPKRRQEHPRRDPGALVGAKFGARWRPESSGGLREAIWLKFWSLRERCSSLFPISDCFPEAPSRPFLVHPPCVANKALQKTTRRNTRPKELEKFSQAGRGGAVTP